jgi:hypothetical protein
VSTAPPARPIAVRNDRQQRHRDDETQHARQHQHLEGIETKGFERIDFLVELHHAELGRIGAAGASGDHDRREQHAELAQHADRHQVNREDLRAERPQLLGADVGQDDADQNAITATTGTAWTPVS